MRRPHESSPDDDGNSLDAGRIYFDNQSAAVHQTADKRNLGAARVMETCGSPKLEIPGPVPRADHAEQKRPVQRGKQIGGFWRA